jgi:hypothetical protein
MRKSFCKLNENEMSGDLKIFGFISVPEFASTERSHDAAVEHDLADVQHLILSPRRLIHISSKQIYELEAKSYIRSYEHRWLDTLRPKTDSRRLRSQKV